MDDSGRVNVFKGSQNLIHEVLDVLVTQLLLRFYHFIEVCLKQFGDKVYIT